MLVNFFNKRIPGRKLLSRQFLFYFLPLFMIAFTTISYSQQINIGSGSHLVMKGNSYLVINNAALKNDGTLNTDTGTIKFTGDADTNVAYISGANQSNVNNIIINKSAYGLSLRSEFVVKDSFGIVQGILYSNGFLTLKSDANKTATLTALPVDGLGTATSYISGKVSIERYIKAHRAWRLLSAPVKNTGTPSTINQAWQEAVTSGNPNANYGIHIIGGTIANGYDQGPTSNASVKVYDYLTNSFVPLPPVPGTHVPISNYSGYFAFIWGNRSVNIFNNSLPATPTTLRMKGEIKAGDQIIPVNATNYTILGNPYPAAIDFGLITKSNVKDRFYAWDPLLAGAYGVGGYVTVSRNGDHYDVTGNVSSISQLIPSGSAVMIESLDGATVGSVTIKESNKANSGNQGPLARNGIDERISTLLYESNADESKSLVDAVLTTFDAENINEIDYSDAPKIGTKYLGLKRGNALFAIERRKTIETKDTIYLNINGLSIRNYKLNAMISNMETSGLQAILKDRYSAVLNNKLLNMNDSNFIEFQVSTDPASYAANRFSIVFESLGPVPVIFKNIKASKKEVGILVSWDIENEMNVNEYVLEKSLNGLNFYPLHSNFPTLDNGGAITYSYLDESVVVGYNFYRVRSIFLGTSPSYSEIVKVNVEAVEHGIKIFPNPVSGSRINLIMMDQVKGSYQLRLLTTNGQVVCTDKLIVDNANYNYSFTIKQQLPKGLYHLEIIKPDDTSEIKKVFIK